LAARHVFILSDVRHPFDADSLIFLLHCPQFDYSVYCRDEGNGCYYTSRINFLQEASMKKDFMKNAISRFPSLIFLFVQI